MATTHYKLAENKDLGYVDVNTGLFSNRFFKTIIAKQVLSFERYQTFFSIVLVTISEKAVKDAHTDLKEMAALVRENVRVVDEIGSSGSGQFCILLPHTMFQGAKIVADRLADVLSERLASQNSKDLKVEVLSMPESLKAIKELAEVDEKSA